MHIAALVLALSSSCIFAASSANVVFMEPEGEPKRATEGNDPSQVYRIVSDANKMASYQGWMQNDAARRALRLFEQARAIAAARSMSDLPSAYYVALIPGGNHAAVGFRLRDERGLEDHGRIPFIKLEADPDSFQTTFLHETGHVVLYLLNGARSFPGRDIAPIPHSTAALSDRGTALSEGFTIHLETLAAHLASEPAIINYYQHRRVRFG